ncbi:MAG: hypothetical protein MI864_07560 [Pseudomonadales bacterium]|nr:hypothetical protein [Pseudomonadales bacterium]
MAHEINTELIHLCNRYHEGQLSFDAYRAQRKMVLERLETAPAANGGARAKTASVHSAFPLQKILMISLVASITIVALVLFGLEFI